MIAAADIRALRARLKEPQDKFGRRFGVSRFHVMNWEKYGIADSPIIEATMLKLGGADGRMDDAAGRLATGQT